MPRIILCLLLCVAAGCVESEDRASSLTTAHATAIVSSVVTATGFATEVRSLDDDATLATIDLTAATGVAALGWPDGAAGPRVELPPGALSLPAWNAAAYAMFQLALAQRTDTGAVELCHQNAAGAGCRGACGVDCDSCKVRWVCAKANAHCGGAGNNLVWFKKYACYQRPCCVSHDACYDACSGPLCRRKCDSIALANGCNMDDANGKTWAAADATAMPFYHPTGIPCTVEGAITKVEPRATVVVVATSPDQLGADSSTETGGHAPAAGSPSGAAGPAPDVEAPALDAADCAPGGPPAPPAPDPVCTDWEAWLCQVSGHCPEDASCASCIWGS